MDAQHSRPTDLLIEVGIIRSQLDDLKTGVASLHGLAGAVARSVQSNDFIAAELKEKDEDDKKLRQDIHSLATALSNHHVVLFGPQGSHKMGVVSDVSTLMAAHNQRKGAWIVLIAASTLGPMVGAVIGWVLRNFVPLPPHP